VLTEKQKIKNLELYQKSLKEDQWEPLETIPDIPVELREQIGLGKIPCPVCHDARDLYIPCRGLTTKIEYPQRFPCKCRQLQYFYPRYHKAVPVHDRHITLKDLAPHKGSKLSLAVQKNSIKIMKAHPYDSYSLFGPVGTSKTTYAVALYHNALTRIAREGVHTPECIWRVSARRLLQEFHFWDTNRAIEVVEDDGNGTVNRKMEKATPPSVNRDNIKRAADAGLVPRLFFRRDG
jgi:hypothetical protein